MCRHSIGRCCLLTLSLLLCVYVVCLPTQAIASFIDVCLSPESELVDAVMKKGLELIYHHHFQAQHA